VDLAGGVFENHFGEDGGVGFIGQVGAEAYAYVEGSVDAQVDGWAELVHGFAFEAHVEGERVAVFFDADAFRHHVDEAVWAGAAGAAAASDAILHIFDADVLFGALG